MEKDNKKQTGGSRRHLIIALSIIGVALVVAVLIAVFAIVANLNNKVNGKNPTELYADVEQTVSSSTNYKVYARKTGGGAIMSGKDVFIDADIETVEEACVDGANFYYSKTLTIVRDNEKTTTTAKVTVADGVSYFYFLKDGGVATMTKAPVTAANQDQINRLVQSLIWDYDELFEDVKFEESNGLYKVEMNEENASDPEFAKALSTNAQMFFEDNMNQLKFGYPKDFEDYGYVIMYDDDGRPVSVSFEYIMGNSDFFVGELSVRAGFEYGTVEVTAPENAALYQ